MQFRITCNQIDVNILLPANCLRLIILFIVNMIAAMDNYDLIIIGAGAAGLFAAGKCSAAGIKTAVFDGMDNPGRKLLITGQGRCNITNTAELPDFIKHFGDKQRFVKKCLYSFSSMDLINLLSSEGLNTICRGDGKVFPESERSADVLKQLLMLCNKSYTNFRFSNRICSISHESKTFTVKSEEGLSCRSPKLLLASGGFTFPSTGSRGDGFRLAASLGHNIITPRPSLTAIISREEDFSSCAGISLDAGTALYREGRKLTGRRGALLFTHLGLSGPLIIDNSREMMSGDRLEVNLLPEITEAELGALFLDYCENQGRNRVKTFFTGLSLPDRLTAAVFSRIGITPDKKAAEVTKKQRSSLIHAFTGLTFHIKQLEGKKKAMCTAGGVDTAEIKPSTMESKIITGLYFAGEVIDVDGDSGGYNLQFAFSSASAAAESIIRKN